MTPSEAYATREGGAVGAFVRGGIQGLSAGWGDELQEGLEARFPSLADGSGLTPRQKNEAMKADSPYAYGAGEFIGSIVPMAVTGGTLGKAGIVSQMGALGAVTGAGKSETDRMQGATEGLLMGMGGAGVGSAGAKAIGAGVKGVGGVAGYLGQSFGRRAGEARKGIADAAATEAKVIAQETGKQIEALPERVAADLAKREAADAKRLLLDAKTAAQASPEAVALAEAKAAMQAAKEGLKGAKGTLEGSAEKATMDAAKAEAARAKAALDATKKAWESSPKAIHMREAAQDVAFATKKFETLKELRRLSPEVQAATRKAWDVKKGWDETQITHLLSPEARALVRHLDKEALQTIRDNGLTPAIETARKTMKVAEKKLATSRQAGEKAEEAARESIKLADRLHRTAAAKLAAAQKNPTDAALRGAVDEAQKAAVRAEQAFAGAQTAAQQSTAAAQLERAQAMLLDAERQAARLGRQSLAAEAGMKGPLNEAIAAARTTKDAAIGAKRALDGVPETRLSQGMRAVSEKRKGDDTIDMGAAAWGAGLGVMMGGPAGAGAGAVLSPLAKSFVASALRDPVKMQAAADALMRASQTSVAIQSRIPTLARGLSLGTEQGTRQLLERHVAMMEQDPDYAREIEMVEPDPMPFGEDPETAAALSWLESRGMERTPQNLALARVASGG
jgi:hypothetical protein